MNTASKKVIAQAAKGSTGEFLDALQGLGTVGEGEKPENPEFDQDIVDRLESIQMGAERLVGLCNRVSINPGLAERLKRLDAELANLCRIVNR